MKKRHLSKTEAFFIILFCSVIVLSVPLLMRAAKYDYLLIGKESYYHARIADTMAKGGVFSYDELSYGGRQYHFNLYHWLLAQTSKLTGITFASKFLPYLFGIMSIVMFFFILQKLKIGTENQLAVCLILLVTPVFIYITTTNPLSLSILLSLSGFYLLMNKTRGHTALAVLFFAATVFLGFLSALATIILLAILLIKPRLAKKPLQTALIIVLLATVLFYAPFYMKNGLPEKPNFITGNIIMDYVSDLGSNSFAPFAILLALIGFVKTWNKKQRHYPLYLAAVLFFAVSIPTKNIQVYFAFIISISAGHAFVGLIRAKWRVALIKNLTIFILLLGLLFSTLSYITRLGNSLPNQEIYESLTWLRQNSDEKSLVFSHYSNGVWIESFAQRPSFMDSIFGNVKANQRYEISEQIFYSRNLENTRETLQKNNISFIYITPNMKSGLVWTRENQGLLFLFRNNETFNNVYDKDGIEIWEHKRG